MRLHSKTSRGSGGSAENSTGTMAKVHSHRCNIPRLIPNPDEVLISQCWCMKSYVEVTSADVLNGRTISCHQQGCVEP